jgi:hypothetical protein
MTLIEAMADARTKRDAYNQDAYVLKDNDKEYFTTIKSNISIFLNKLEDKRTYYTAWYFKK